MIQIIGRKIYDTEKAEFIYETYADSTHDRIYRLYKTKAGNFFKVTQIIVNNKRENTCITPMSTHDVIRWLEHKNAINTLLQYFNAYIMEA